MFKVQVDLANQVTRQLLNPKRTQATFNFGCAKAKTAKLFWAQKIEARELVNWPKIAIED